VTMLDPLGPFFLLLPLRNAFNSSVTRSSSLLSPERRTPSFATITPTESSPRRKNLPRDKNPHPSSPSSRNLQIPASIHLSPQNYTR
jgi:hypothetical protein